ncbi:MAG: hypothetical protein JW976_01300 [Syntrophaceae bacterium]|nr:hypothetical protein [Syntrophaceae bacterium]
MKKIEDEDLADVNAAALNFDMNISVRSVVSGGIQWINENPATATSDIINIASLEACNGTRGTAFAISTTMSWDIGFNGTDQWLAGGNVALPTVASGGLGLYADSVVFRNNNATNLPMANVVTTGVWFGQPLTAPNPDITPSAGSVLRYPWYIISNRNEAGDRQGIKAYGEIGLYVDSLVLKWREANYANVAVTGVYIYGLDNNIAGGDASAWSARQGMIKIGGAFPTFDAGGTASGGSYATFATIDVGTSGAGRTQRIQINMPIAGGIRIKNMQFGYGGGIIDWGPPLALDGAVFYKNQLTIREL